VLWKAVIPILPYSYRKGWPLVVIEYSVLVLPLLLGVTVLAEQPVLLNVGLVVFALGCRWRRAHNIPPYARPSESSPKIPTSPHPRSAETPVTLFSGSENDDHAKKHDSADPSQDIQIPLPSSIFQKSFVSVWRAHMMLMTIICILAVDFPIFPRGFGKCESWGTSLVRTHTY
jgi:phosphatidylinositol glycan class W